MKVEIILDFEQDSFKSELEMKVGVNAALQKFLNEHGEELHKQLLFPFVSHKMSHYVHVGDFIR